MSWLLLLYATLMGLLGLISVVLAYLTISRLPEIEAPGFDAPAPEQWPLVSILVPACNEEAEIEEAMQSLLDEDYPNLEVIAINDRSTDRTGELLEALAATDSRLQVVHVKELPDGWLGKVHALHKGYESAEGSWVLLADADVHIRPGALKRIIAWCLQHNADHFTLVPDIWRADFFADIAWGLGYLGLLSQRLWEVPDPKKSAHIGTGAFNLLRREAFEETPKFEWFRLDVADDWALGLLMKQEAKQCYVANARNCVHLPWYRSFPQMVQGMEKNAFAILGHYSLLRCLAYAALLPALYSLPLLLFAAPQPWLGLLASLWLLGNGMAGMMMHRWMGRPMYLAWFFPLAAWLQGYIVLRAGIRGWRRGGVSWRGTFYPKEQMLKHMKVRF